VLRGLLDRHDVTQRVGPAGRGERAAAPESGRTVTGRYSEPQREMEQAAIGVVMKRMRELSSGGVISTHPLYRAAPVVLCTLEWLAITRRRASCRASCLASSRLVVSWSSSQGGLTKHKPNPRSRMLNTPLAPASTSVPVRLPLHARRCQTRKCRSRILVSRSQSLTTTLDKAKETLLSWCGRQDSRSGSRG
jgi:hypothetical protein